MGLPLGTGGAHRTTDTIAELFIYIFILHFFQPRVQNTVGETWMINNVL